MRLQQNSTRDQRFAPNDLVGALDSCTKGRASDANSIDTQCSKKLPQGCNINKPQRRTSLLAAVNNKRTDAQQKYMDWKAKQQVPPGVKVFCMAGTGAHSVGIRSGLLARGWVENMDHDSKHCDFKWAVKCAEVDHQALWPSQVINHFASSDYFTTKMGLCRMMQKLVWCYPANKHEFWPRCYDLTDASEVAAFVADSESTAAESVLRQAIQQQQHQQRVIDHQQQQQQQQQRQVVDHQQHQQQRQVVDHQQQQLRQIVDHQQQQQQEEQGNQRNSKSVISDAELRSALLTVADKLYKQRYLTSCDGPPAGVHEQDHYVASIRKADMQQQQHFQQQQQQHMQMQRQQQGSDWQQNMRDGWKCRQRLLHVQNQRQQQHDKKLSKPQRQQDEQQQQDQQQNQQQQQQQDRQQQEDRHQQEDQQQPHNEWLQQQGQQGLSVTQDLPAVHKDACHAGVPKIQPTTMSTLVGSTDDGGTIQQQLQDTLVDTLVFKASALQQFNRQQLIAVATQLLSAIEHSTPQSAINGTRNIWILKPAGKSRGRGIQLFHGAEALLQAVAAECAGGHHAWVAQKYIERPLLIHNRKFDIRQWVLVTSWNPLKVWFYDKCYLRFSATPYKPDDLNIYSHLCNNSISKCHSQQENTPSASSAYTSATAASSSSSSSNLGECVSAAHTADERSITECGNMWTVEQFKTWLQQQQQGQAGSNDDSNSSCGGSLNDVWEQQIVPGMQEIVKAVITTAKEGVVWRPGSFQLFGFDFLLDECCHVWLLEVNSSPTLEPTTPVTAGLCAAVQEDILKVVVDLPQHMAAAAAARATKEGGRPQDQAVTAPAGAGVSQDQNSSRHTGRCNVKLPNAVGGWRLLIDDEIIVGRPCYLGCDLACIGKGIATAAGG